MIRIRKSNRNKNRVRMGMKKIKRKRVATPNLGPTQLKRQVRNTTEK